MPGQPKPRPARHDNWLAPLFFEGQSEDGSGYFHIPPLLTFTHHTARSGFNLAGPLFCKWKGGPTCDPRSADKIDLGLAPLYFYGRDESSEYEVIPPLLHYYHYSDVGDRSTNLWGPLLWEHSREGESDDGREQQRQLVGQRAQAGAMEPAHQRRTINCRGSGSRRREP